MFIIQLATPSEASFNVSLAIWGLDFFFFSSIMSAQLFPIVRIIFNTVKCCDSQPLKQEISLFIAVKGRAYPGYSQQIKVLGDCTSCASEIYRSHK